MEMYFEPVQEKQPVFSMVLTRTVSGSIFWIMTSELHLVDYTLGINKLSCDHDCDVSGRTCHKHGQRKQCVDQSSKNLHHAQLQTVTVI